MKHRVTVWQLVRTGLVGASVVCAQLLDGTGLQAQRPAGQQFPALKAWVDGQRPGVSAAVFVLDAGRQLRWSHRSAGLAADTAIPLGRHTSILHATALEAVDEKLAGPGDATLAQLFPESEELRESGLAQATWRAVMDRELRFERFYDGLVTDLAEARSVAEVLRTNVHPSRARQAREGSARAVLVQWLVERGLGKTWDRVVLEVLAPRLGLRPEQIWPRAPEGTAWIPPRPLAVREVAADSQAAVALAALPKLPFPDGENRTLLWANVFPEKVNARWLGDVWDGLGWLAVGERVVIVYGPWRDGGLSTFLDAVCRDLTDHEVSESRRTGGLRGGRGEAEESPRKPVEGRYRGPIEWRRGSAQMSVEAVNRAAEDTEAKNGRLRVRIGSEVREIDVQWPRLGKRELFFRWSLAPGRSLSFNLECLASGMSGFVTERIDETGARFPFRVQLDRVDLARPKLEQLIDAMPEDLLPIAGSEGPARVFAAIVGDAVHVSVGGRLDSANGRPVTTATPILADTLTRLLTVAALERYEPEDAWDGSVWLSCLRPDGRIPSRGPGVSLRHLFENTRQFSRYLKSGDSARPVLTIVEENLHEGGTPVGVNRDGSFAVLQRSLWEYGALDEGPINWIGEQLSADGLSHTAFERVPWSYRKEGEALQPFKAEVDLAHAVQAAPEDLLRALRTASELVPRFTSSQASWFRVLMSRDLRIPDAHLVRMSGEAPRTQIEFRSFPELSAACLAFTTVPAGDWRGRQSEEELWPGNVVSAWITAVIDDGSEYTTRRSAIGLGGFAVQPIDEDLRWHYRGGVRGLPGVSELAVRVTKGRTELYLDDVAIRLEGSLRSPRLRARGTLSDGSKVDLRASRSFLGSELTVDLVWSREDDGRDVFRLPVRSTLRLVRE